jgi:hypothetical protein
VLRHQDVVAGELAVLSLGAMVLAALTPRLTGTVEMGLSGFKMELVKLTDAGRLIQYAEEDILAAIEDRLDPYSANYERPTSESLLTDAEIERLRHRRDGRRSRLDLPPKSTDRYDIDRSAEAQAEMLAHQADHQIGIETIVRPRLLVLAIQQTPLSPEQVHEIRAAAESLLKQGEFSASGARR